MTKNLSPRAQLQAEFVVMVLGDHAKSARNGDVFTEKIGHWFARLDIGQGRYLRVPDCHQLPGMPCK